MWISEGAYKKLLENAEQKNRRVREKKRKGLTETEIQNQIREHLRWAGWFVIRHQQGLGCHKGLSDLTAIRDGRTVYIEVKRPNGVLSEYQEEFQRQIEAHGGTYIVARSVDDVAGLCGR